jgi:hypothetical protein
MVPHRQKRIITVTERAACRGAYLEAGGVRSCSSAVLFKAFLKAGEGNVRSATSSEVIKILLAQQTVPCTKQLTNKTPYV